MSPSAPATPLPARIPALFRVGAIALALFLVAAMAGCVGVKYTDQPLTTVDLTDSVAPPEIGTRVLARGDEWRNTGVFVRKGVPYRIMATAKWRVGAFCHWSDADGLGIYTPLCLDLGGKRLKGWSHGALIARVGENGPMFGVGKSYTFTAADDGILYLCINDAEALTWDNEGHADVNISLARTPVATLPKPGAPQATTQALPHQTAPQTGGAPPATPGARAKKKSVSQAEATTPAPAQAPASPPPSAGAEAPAQEPVEPASIPQGTSGLRRVALVIGNSAYPNAPLRNPVNDARDMAAILRSLGFEVILRENASLRQMEEAVDLLWVRLKGGGAGLFFFAGHGLQVAGRNYLVPVDARLQAEQDVKYRCMDAGLVLGRMENAGNPLNIVILDACRNNPYARSWRSANEGLAKMDAPRGSLVAYATAPDSVAADGSGKNGIYTGQLLKNLRTPGIGIEELFKRVRIGVLKESGNKQVPWESSSLTGYFTFNEAGR